MKSRGLLWAAALAGAVVLVAVLAAVLRHDNGATQLGSSASPAASGSAWPWAIPAPASAQPTAAASDTPPDVPPDEWAQMKKALGATQEGRKQLPRVGAFLGFKHRAERWEALNKQGVQSAEKTQLAQQLLDDLPDHVGRGEVTGFEARALEAQLIPDAVPDTSQQQQALIAENARIEAAVPKPDPQAASRMAAYKQQEAAITAQWLAMPPAGRDSQWLESQLNAARERAFDAASKP